MRKPITSAIVAYGPTGKGLTISIHRPSGGVKTYPYKWERVLPFIWTAKIGVPLERATVLIY